MPSLSRSVLDGDLAVQATATSPSRRRGRTRPVAESDLPGLAALYVRVFGAPAGGSHAAAASYLGRLLFESPWPDSELPSLMYEDADGRPAGLLGVVARPMVFRGRPIRVAICHHFMVAPETRTTLASVALTKAALAGPQDLTVAEACAPWRQLWEHIGGTTSLLHGLTWTRALRPAGLAVGALDRRGLPRVCSAALHPVSRIIDRTAARMVPMLSAPGSSPLTAASLDADGLCAAMHQLCVGSLQPVWNRHTLQWALDQLRAKVHRGTLFAVGVATGRGDLVGFYLYYAKPGGISHLVCSGARPEYRAQVLEHMVRHAWDQGAAAVAGQLDRAVAPCVAEWPVLLSQPDANWRLVHSGRDDLLNAVHSGEAPLSRFESEWWLTF